MINIILIISINRFLLTISQNHNLFVRNVNQQDEETNGPTD